MANLRKTSANSLHCIVVAVSPTAVCVVAAAAPVPTLTPTLLRHGQYTKCNAAR
jgi:hypothetical protein